MNVRQDLKVTPERLVELDLTMSRIADWARQQLDIVAAIVVGSVARGEARSDSDLDVVILTNQTDAYMQDDRWVFDSLLELAPIVRNQRWGAVFERRVVLSSGLEVEFNFTSPEWASVAPLDDGTARVVGHGCLLLFDRNGLIPRLVSAARAMARFPPKCRSPITPRDH
jgi:uncharacterized protein